MSLKLGTLQRKVFRSLSQPEIKGTQATRLNWIRAEGELTPRERLGIYRYAYLERMRESLLEDFVVLEAILGRKTLRNLVTEYVYKYPSQSPFLENLGSNFSKYLKKHPIGQKMPYLADLAQVEYAEVVTFRELVSSPDRPNEITEESKWKLSPAVFRLKSFYSLKEIYDAGLEGHELAKNLKRPSRTLRTFMVYRKRDWAEFVETTPLEERVLGLSKSPIALRKLFLRLEKEFSAEKLKALEQILPHWIQNKVLLKSEK